MRRKATKHQNPRLGGLLCGLFAGLLMTAVPAMAQNCDITAEEIVRLRPPSFENYSQWNETHGEDGMDQFSDLVVLFDGSVVAAGSYTKDEEDPVYKPYLVHMTPKGEVVWETREEETAFKTINRIIPYKDGYLVLGDLNRAGKGNGIYVAQYNDKGKRVDQWAIYEGKGNLDGKALTLSADGKAVLIAAQLNPQGEFKDQYGILYKYTLSGKRIWRHGYSPGSRSVFNNIQAADTNGYIVSGALQIEDGRMAGWLIRVDDNGAIMWQRNYARGDYSEFLSAASMPDDGLLLGGLSKPSGSKRTAAWVMKVDGAGSTVWQRYYAGAYNYAARDLFAYEDGRADVLVDAIQHSLFDRAHVRLMTFSPRGYLMNVGEFSEGQGSHAFRLVKGPKGERVMAGWAQMKYAEVTSVEEIPVSTYDAWLVAAPSLDPYEDPCKPRSYLP